MLLRSPPNPLGALAEFAEEHEQHVDVRTAASRAAQAAASVSASARHDAALAAAGAGAGADDDVMAAVSTLMGGAP